jgi:ABC-type Mn2+/Zn2+ transport system ATPase subunit
VLLCDEPTGALDSKTGVIVLEALERVNRELGTTTSDHYTQCRAGKYGRTYHLFERWTGDGNQAETNKKQVPVS